MNRLTQPTIALCLAIAGVLRASPEEAVRIEKSWQLEADRWELETRIATTPEQREKVLQSRPDLAVFARRMWNTIGGSLEQRWVLPHASWFLRAASNLIQTAPDGSARPMFSQEIETILSAIEQHHLDSPGLTPVCMALASSADPRSLSILEKIQSRHPDPKIQGVAALCAAIMLKSLSEEPEVLRKRLTYLRKAIIESSDVDLGGSTVAKLAEDELYIIRFLTKGRVAPDLVGTDSGGRPLRLSDHQEKVIILLFWSSTMNEAERVLEITRETELKFRNRKVEIIGVNLDPLEKLRSMEADGIATWKNFSDPSRRLANEYRVGTLPLVYILDDSRKIQYSGAPGSFVELTAEALLADPAPGRETQAPRVAD